MASSLGLDTEGHLCHPELKYLLGDELQENLDLILMYPNASFGGNEWSFHRK